MTGPADAPGAPGPGSGRGRLDVGLTGGIGSGKSEVSRRLAELGAVVVDADLLARQVVAPGSAGLAAVVAEFGPEVLAPDGSLDRPRVAALVFADPDRRERLNAIVHPLVGERARRLADAAAPGSVVVHDVPLLVEAGLADRYDIVVVVDAAEPVRLDRLVRLRGMSEADARARMAAQARPADRLAAADLVIRNDGDLDELDRQVRAAWSQLQARAASATPVSPRREGRKDDGP